MSPSMMESIIMRKCQISYKEAKHLIVLARQQLYLPEESTLLWSKEYETKCIEIHNSQNGNSNAFAMNKLSNDTATPSGNLIRTSTRPVRLQRHHSDSTDGKRSRENHINTTNINKSSNTDSIPRPRQAPEARKSRSLSKPRRRKSPAATRIAQSQQQHHHRTVKPPQSQLSSSSLTSSISSQEESNSQRQQQQRPQSRPRRSVPRKSSSSSTLSSLAAEIQPPSSPFTTNRYITCSSHYSSPQNNSVPAPSLKTTSTVSPTHSHVSMSPFSLNESIHSMTSPRRPQRQLSFDRKDDNGNNKSDIRRERPKRTNSISSKTFQSTDAVVVTTSKENPTIPILNQSPSRQQQRGRGAQPTTTDPSLSARDRSKSIRLRRGPGLNASKSSVHDDDIDDNDTTNAQSPMTSASILRSSNRWNDNKESASPIISKGSNPKVINGGSGRENRKKTFVSEVERLNRSLSYLQREESKKKKMYALPTPLTPEGNARPKFQPGRSGSERSNSKDGTTNRWSSDQEKHNKSLTRQDNTSSSPISQPQMKKLTKREENFFDSFSSSDQKINEESHDGKYLHCSVSPKKDRTEAAPRKPRRSSTNDIDDNKNSSRTFKINSLDHDALSSPTKKPKAKSTTARRRLSDEEIERECQADPFLRNAISTAKKNRVTQRPSQFSNVVDDTTHSNQCSNSFLECDGVDRSSRNDPSNHASLGSFIKKGANDTSNEDNQTVSTDSGASTKSKTRMVLVVKSKSKTIKDIDYGVPVSPSKRRTMVSGPKIASPIGKKISITDPPNQSPLSFERRMAGYKNTCESPVKDKALFGNVPLSPSKFHMIPVVNKSPTQRKSAKKLHDDGADTFKSEMKSPTSNTISKHSVTSRTSYTTDTTISNSSRESDTDDFYSSTKTENKDLPKFHDRFNVASENDIQITEDQIFPEFSSSRFAKPIMKSQGNGNNDENISPQSPHLSSDRAAKYQRMLLSCDNHHHKNNIQNNNDASSTNISMLDQSSHKSGIGNSTGAPKLPQRRKSTIVRE